MKNIGDSLRRPEYTGRRRCWPCTIVNAALVVLACGALAVAGLRVAVPALAVAGGVAIWLRGYFLPYTPRFAPRLTGALPGDPFHATDGGRPDGAELHSLSDADSVDGEVVLETLLGSGVLVPGEGEDLQLSDDVRTDWEAAMASFRALEPAELAARVRALSGAAEVETTTQGTGVWFRLRAESGALDEEVFLSRPVAIAEIAALDTLEAYVDDVAVRRQAVEPLRMFLEKCPVCEQPLVETDTLDCCGGALDKHSEPDPVLACRACERRLYTFPG